MDTVFLFYRTDGQRPQKQVPKAQQTSAAAFISMSVEILFYWQILIDKWQILSRAKPA